MTVEVPQVEWRCVATQYWPGLEKKNIPLKGKRGREFVKRLIQFLSRVVDRFIAAWTRVQAAEEDRFQKSVELESDVVAKPEPSEAETTACTREDEPATLTELIRKRQRPDGPADFFLGQDRDRSDGGK
jgi:hypothetical protein